MASRSHVIICSRDAKPPCCPRSILSCSSSRHLTAHAIAAPAIAARAIAAYLRSALSRIHLRRILMGSSSDFSLTAPFAVAVFAIVFYAYSATVFPNISSGDSGELAAAACSGSTMHPPGYPLFALTSQVPACITLIFCPTHACPPLSFPSGWWAYSYPPPRPPIASTLCRVHLVQHALAWCSLHPCAFPALCNPLCRASNRNQRTIHPAPLLPLSLLPPL